MTQKTQPGLVAAALISDSKNWKFAPAGRMAAVIVKITQEQGGCLPQDLNAHGFTPDEVFEHWQTAQSLAAVELRLMGQQSANLKSFLGRK